MIFFPSTFQALFVTHWKTFINNFDFSLCGKQFGHLELHFCLVFSRTLIQSKYFPGSEPMDRESQDKFVLIVEAYDNYHFGFTTGDSRHSFAQVVISVTDVNDQVPVFEVEEQNNSPHNCAIINEFHDIGKKNMPL